MRLYKVLENYLMEKRPKYLLCPRCELNYFVPSKNQKYCTVCLAEMNQADPSILIPEDEDNDLEVLCPTCKVNYMAPEEEMCFVCTKEHREKLASVVELEEWKDDDTDTPVEDDSIEISLTELEEEENDIEDEDVLAQEEFESDDFFNENDEDEDEDFEDEEEEDFINEEE